MPSLKENAYPFNSQNALDKQYQPVLKCFINFNIGGSNESPRKNITKNKPFNYYAKNGISFYVQNIIQKIQNQNIFSDFKHCISTNWMLYFQNIKGGNNE